MRKMHPNFLIFFGLLIKSTSSISRQSEPVECKIQGLCNLEHIVGPNRPNVKSYNDCLRICKATPECEFFSFGKFLFDSYICSIFDECYEFVEGFDLTVTGQKECEYDQSGSTKLLVIPRANMEKTGIEVIDLSDVFEDCDPFGELPPQMRPLGDVASLVDGNKPVYCTLNWDQECYLIGNGGFELVATLETRHYNGASVAIGSKMWITGGTDGVFGDFEITAATSILDMLTEPPSVKAGPDLPMPMYGHKMVQIHDTLVMVFNDKKTFMFDWLSMTWSNGPDVSSSVFSCEVMTGKNGEKIVVLVTSDEETGVKRTEFLNLGNDDLQWAEGPSVPFTFEPLVIGAMVPFGDTVVFVEADSERNHCRLFKLECYLLSCTWIDTKKELKNPKQFFLAMMVPDELVNCQKKFD